MRTSLIAVAIAMAASAASAQRTQDSPNRTPLVRSGSAWASPAAIDQPAIAAIV
jgi:hypothetical protein